MGKNCSGLNGIQGAQHLRLLGTMKSHIIPEDLIDERINDVVLSHLKNTGEWEARKVPVMKGFEEFLYSSDLKNKSLVTAIRKTQ